MKIMISAFLVAVAAAAAGTPAQAQNYPWCEYIGSMNGGGRNCGFVSFEQCMESARGNGSDCRRNTQYEPPAPAVRQQTRRKAHKNS
jgi:hypothetical protein